jgi:hypothetical protein
MQMSTALNNGRDQWRFKEGDGDFDQQWRNMARTGSSEGRLCRGKDKENGEGLAALMDALAQVEAPRTR